MGADHTQPRLALTRRPIGDYGDNLEQAVVCPRATLEVFTREATPDEWAMAMDNLGAIYQQRIRGDQADNLEQAIACYRGALRVFGQANTPVQSATSVDGLASVRRRWTGRYRSTTSASPVYSGAAGPGSKPRPVPSSTLTSR